MELIEFGKIVNTHGLNGELKIYSYTDDPERILKLKEIYIDEIKYVVKSIRLTKNMFVVKLKEVDSIDDTEPFINKYVYRKIDSDELKDEEAFFYKDLIGSLVYNTSGEKIGMLKDVYNTGANDIYVVLLEDSKEILLPVIKQVVKEIDIKNKKIIVEIMEGLM